MMKADMDGKDANFGKAHPDDRGIIFLPLIPLTPAAVHSRHYRFGMKGSYAEITSCARTYDTETISLYEIAAVRAFTSCETVEFRKRKLHTPYDGYHGQLYIIHTIQISTDSNVYTKSGRMQCYRDPSCLSLPVYFCALQTLFGISNPFHRPTEFAQLLSH